MSKLSVYVFNVCCVKHVSVHVGIERHALSSLVKARI
jgi:hypothetical protein